MGERKLERKGKRRRREKLHFLSRFYGNRTFGFRRSKRQSSSMRRGLRIETKIWDFRLALRGTGFYPTRFNSYLRAIQIVKVFGAKSSVHFSSNNLGLNAGLWDYFWTVRGWIFGVVLGYSGTEISRMFSDCSELDYETEFRTVHVYSFVCIAKSEQHVFV